ncbi:MAG: hypothetical protein ACU85E_09675 [Gammaproteobacteria bacterium]
MAGVGFIDEAVLFSPNMPQPVNALLQAAVVASRSDKIRAEQLFYEAYQLDKACLQTYFALYKFYFYQARLEEAEKFVLAGLKEAARQGEFPADYRCLYRDRGKWDLYANDTTLFYLYTLKALAFIKLRQDQITQAQILLAMMKELDPEDRSGASVIIALAEAMKGER